MNSLINNNKIQTMLLYVFLICLCTFEGLKSLGFPAIIDGAYDFLILLMLFFLLYQHKNVKIYSLVIIQCFMCVAGILVSVVNKNDFLSIVLGLRSIGRFLIFFTFCVSFLHIKDIEKIFKLLFIIFIVNIIAILIQYYCLGFKQDVLNGIFGCKVFTNSFSNVFFVIVIEYIICNFLFNKCSLFVALIFIFFSAFCSALMEIKYYFAELLLMVMGTSFLYLLFERKPSKIKSIIILNILSIVFIILCIKIMLYIFPHWNRLNSTQAVVNELTSQSGYSGTGEINRLFFVNTINRNFFNGEKFKEIFGLGIGATELYRIGKVVNDTSVVFNKLMVKAFFIPWMYTEFGIFGVVMYILSIITSLMYGFIKYVSKKVRIDNSNKYIVYGLVINVITLPLLIYDSSLRNHNGYFIMFGISIMYIALNNKDTNANEGDAIDT